MRERGRDTGRRRSRPHVGSPTWNSIPGSCRGLKAGAKPLSHPGIPIALKFKKIEVLLSNFSDQWYETRNDFGQNTNTWKLKNVITLPTNGSPKKWKGKSKNKKTNENGNSTV